MHSFPWPRLPGVLAVLAAACCAAPAAARTSARDAQRIDVYPTRLVLNAKRARAQLVVTGLFSDGARDLTREADYKSSDPRVVTIRKGVAHPVGDGKATIVVRAGGKSAEIAVEVSRKSEPDPIRFRYETLAALTKQGCNAGSCHGSPEGKGGFSLSLFAYAPELDRRALVRGGFNRRTNVYDPDESLIIKKPLLRIPHVGGKRLRRSDAAYAILRGWIHEGARGDPAHAPRCVKISLHPGPLRVLREPYLSQQISVSAHFEDGGVRDVTAIAKYSTSATEVAQVDAAGLVTGKQRGQAAITVRYLEHLESIYITVVQDVKGFEWAEAEAEGEIDRLVNARLKLLQYPPSPICSDAVFLRRVHFDLTGLPPTPARAREFLADKFPEKRSALIDALLDDPAFARFQALRLADLLRVNPNVLKDGRAQLFADWLAAAIRENLPFDELARRMLTASGDTKVVAPANYYAAIPATEDLAEATAQVFMGSRIQCAKCHNHPFENWTQDDYYRIAAVFHRVKRDQGVVTDAAGGEMRHPRSGQVMKPWAFTDELQGNEANGADLRRRRFARWLTDPTNEFFARVEANRIWAHLLGKGIVDPIDDFRSSNPPSNVALLDALAREFQQHGFDRKHLFRIICNSRAYQRSTATNKLNEADDELSSHARVRLLTAEQLADAIGYVTGSLAPIEQLPEDTEKRRQRLNRFATQRSFPEQTEFLRAFGQPARQTPCACERSNEPTLDQALQLLNGRRVHEQVEKSVERFGSLEDKEFIDELYHAAFSRPPAAREQRTALSYLAQSKSRDEAIRDLVWAVLNTQEFMFQH